MLPSMKPGRLNPMIDMEQFQRLIPTINAEISARSARTWIYAAEAA